MILPSGINKATGLAAALEEMGLSAHNVVGIGDAENDHAFLRAVGYGVAVANALPKLKETADRTTKGSRGAGVVELIDEIIALDAGLARHGAPAHRGRRRRRRRRRCICRRMAAACCLAGTSGIGKSTLATALTERFVEQGFQFCVLDPEGDYEELEDVVVVGDADNPPSTREIFDLLSKPSNNVAVNMLGLKTDERPDYFAKLLPELAEMRDRTGRPHWLVIDEAHHLMPAARDGASFACQGAAGDHPDHRASRPGFARCARSDVETVMALGPEADKVDRELLRGDRRRASRQASRRRPRTRCCSGTGRRASRPTPISVEGPRQTRKRHKRKYAEGDLGDQQLLFPRAGRRAQAEGAESDDVPAHRRRHRRPHLEASPRGRRLFRAGFATRSRTRNSPTRPPTSRPTTASMPPKAAPASPKRCCAATRFLPTECCAAEAGRRNTVL